jgi:hypothetical protein
MDSSIGVARVEPPSRTNIGRTPHAPYTRNDAHREQGIDKTKEESNQIKSEQFKSNLVHESNPQQDVRRTKITTDIHARNGNTIIMSRNSNRNSCC